MPIRFRCAYCNQLMGIARRKAGTVVSCPNCSGQVVVPAEDADDDAAAGSAPTGPPPGDTVQPLFERGDFEDLFRSAPGGGTVPSAPPPPPPPSPAVAPAPRATGPMTAAQAPLPPARLEPSPGLPSPVAPPQLPRGYVISPSMATLLTVALIVALALAFTAGLLVGRFYLQPSDSGSPSGVLVQPDRSASC